MNSSRRELVLDSAEARQFLHRKTRRGFLAAGIGAVASITGYEWLTRAGQIDGVPWPQRDVLNANGGVFNSYFSGARLMPAFPASRIESLKPNGNVGLDSPPDGSEVKLSTPWAPDLTVNLADIQQLPTVSMITRFCCIEGWSRIVQWKGARFSDFLEKYAPRGKTLPPYVYMATPGEDYYVGLDRKSAVHPQTLLAWEHNGAPLAPEHGAPLRLVIPVKYGIKNIKRIGIIQLTDKRPADYWAEEGYDWYAGL